MPRQDEKRRMVWSSEPGEVNASRRGFGSASDVVGACPPPSKQVARLSRSRRGRAGKTVIIIEGLVLTPEGYLDLAHDLRQALGTGGTVKDHVIEIQGDIRDRVADLLVARGYRIKLVGG
jgi:translation initiation factor 1